MSQFSKRSALPAMAAVALIALGPQAPSAAAAPATRNCSPVTVTFSGGATGRAFGIRATGYSCRRARVVIRACLRDRLRGWRVSTAPSPDDRDPNGLVGLDRRSAHLSFQISGRGGCV